MADLLMAWVLTARTRSYQGLLPCSCWSAPRRQSLAGITTVVVVAALFGLGAWAFHDVYQFPFESQLIVVPGPGGTIELEPGQEPFSADLDSGPILGLPGRPMRTARPRQSAPRRLR